MTANKPTLSKSNSAHNQKLGRWGEDTAAAYLEERGYQVLEKNYRTSYGELDLVCLMDGALVFIEVKTRSSSWSGLPEDGLTPEKIDHLLSAADEYVFTHPEYSPIWRVDLVAIIGKPGQANIQIDLFEDVAYE